MGLGFGVGLGGFGVGSGRVGFTVLDGFRIGLRWA